MTDRRLRVGVVRAASYAVLLIAALQALGPILWVVAGSFKTQAEFLLNPWRLPRDWVFHNYIDAFVVARVGDYVWNSLTVVTLGLLILLLAASTTAYALVRFRFPGRSLVTGVILITMMMPSDVLTIPLLVVLRSLGILGTFFGLACLFAASGFGISVFLLRGYFVSVPPEVEEAARLDGASTLSTLWYVVLPMTLPGVASVALIQAMAMWNDLYLSFVFLRDPASATVPVGLLNLLQRDSVDWPRLLAGLSALTVPILVVYAVLQRHFVEGLTAGAAK